MARKKAKAKEPVKIRFKQLANGNKSIYLDIYHNGKRTYEFLKEYIVPENSPEATEQNNKIMQAVTAIKSQRIVDIANGKAGIVSTRDNKILLIDWMKQCKETQALNGKKVIPTINNVINVIRLYKGDKIMLKDIDTKYCIGLNHYLLTTPTTRTHKPLAKSSIAVYCMCLNTILGMAVRAGLIDENPYKKLSSAEKVRGTESTREYLTIDEIKKMANTFCCNEQVKFAYMFACFCGLRISDIEQLVWKDIIKQDDGTYRIEKVMKKTQCPIYLPLSEAAFHWLPKRYSIENSTQRIYSLPSRTKISSILNDWAKRAGINKHITFHTSRHTFATTMLTLGADLYTTSKLLGHTNVGTTQIYAKIIDQKKTEAINLMNGILK